MLVYAGIDEAGYGPMFGPLLVARMVLALPELSPDDEPPPLWQRLRKAVCRELTGRKGRIAINDSKKLLAASQRWVGLRAGVARDEERAEVSEIEVGQVMDEEDPHPGPLPGTGEGEEPSPRPSPRGRGGRGEPSSTACASPDDAVGSGAVVHLERGVLAFAALAGHRPGTLGDWLECLGETCHRALDHLPWYLADDRRPWQAVPCACTAGEVAVARSLLATTAKRVGVEALDIGAAVVFEDRFNQMLAATRSKAAASFTFVGGHLRAVWDRFGEHRPHVVVDRQSGRMHYREMLALLFPEARLAILEESADRSAYRLDAADRAMSVRFEVDSEVRHMPVALASMISKYTRELLMARLQGWFLQRAPHVKPTAGYALDARRFWSQIEPILPALAVDPATLVRADFAWAAGLA